MIKSLSIRNFQSWSEGSFNFHNGVNVIVGLSDCGKSAILRALRWLLTNRPSGETFRSHWGGDTSVTLSTDEDDSVTRLKKGKTGNQYILNGQVLEAFGQDVPSSISTALDMDELNTQWQFDSPFLLADSPGEVARQLNKVTKLDKIDSSFKFINGLLLKNRSQLGEEASRIEHLQEILSQFDWLPMAEKDLAKAEESKRLLDDIINDRAGLVALVSKIDNLQQELLHIPDTDEAETEITDILIISNQTENIRKQISDLKDLIIRIEVETTIIKQTEDVESDIPLLTILIKDSTTLETLTQTKNNLCSLSRSIQEQQKQIDDETDIVNNLSERWNQEAPDLCPLCEGKGKLR